MLEESGVQVTDVRLLGDQPWPFPSSIMVGATARAVTTQPVSYTHLDVYKRQRHYSLKESR